MNNSLLRLAVLGLLTVGLVLIWSYDAGDSKLNYPTASHMQTPDPSPVAVESRLLFGGDVYWGRLFEREAPGNYKFPFSGLSTLNKGQYNAWIVNTECPITDEIVSFEDQWEAIQFNCQPEYLEEAAKWFDVVSLANNHTNNVRGMEGLKITRTNLEQAGIQHFGNYEPGVLEDLCEIITVDASVKMSDDNTEPAKLPIALCGYHGVFREFTEVEINRISKYSKYFITISMPHAGAEYVASSDPIRERAYRAMIDAGADAVIGNHPHWIQSTEAYLGKLIVYSMGNFIFDQEFNREVTRSALIDTTITLEYGDDVDKYLKIASTCSGFKDNCLKNISSLGIEKPLATFMYDVVPTRTNSLVTSLDANGKQAILERMNWQTTLSALNE